MLRRSLVQKGPAILSPVQSSYWRHERKDKFKAAEDKLAQLQAADLTHFSDTAKKQFERKIAVATRDLVELAHLDGVAAIIKLQKDHNIPLRPFYYNSLLRVFLHQNDRQNVEQLWELMCEEYANFLSYKQNPDSSGGGTPAGGEAASEEEKPLVFEAQEQDSQAEALSSEDKANDVVAGEYRVDGAVAASSDIDNSFADVDDISNNNNSSNFDDGFDDHDNSNTARNDSVQSSSATTVGDAQFDGDEAPSASSSDPEAAQTPAAAPEQEQAPAPPCSPIDVWSYALVINAVHLLTLETPQKSVFDVSLQLVQEMQKALGTLTIPDVNGARSPLLSALLYLVCLRDAGGPLAAALVAVWMAALGASLDTWDHSHLLECWIRDREAFPSLRRVFTYDSSCAKGRMKLSTVLDRTVEHCTNTKKLVNPSVMCIVDAMRHSLPPERLKSMEISSLPFLNSGMTTLPLLLDTVLESFAKTPCLGPSVQNAAHVYHYLMHTYSGLGYHTQSVECLNLLVRDLKAYQMHDFAEAVEAKKTEFLEEGKDDAAAAAAAAKVTELRQEGEEDESFFDPIDVDDTLPLSSKFKPFQIADETVLFDVSDNFQFVSKNVRERTYPALVELCEEYSDNDVVAATAHIPLIQSASEANEVCDAFLAELPRGGRLSKNQLQHVRRLLLLCSLQPPPNPKLTSVGRKEREQWYTYYEARDIALTLVGNSNMAPETMKHAYKSGGKLKALKNVEATATDIQDVNDIFAACDVLKQRKNNTKVAGKRPNTANFRSVARTPQLLFDDSNNGVGPNDDECQWGIYPSSVRQHVGRLPRHMWDPAVFNPFPHVKIRHPHGSFGWQGEQDPFTKLFPALDAHEDEAWFDNPDVFVLVLRCLLHRLDWENATRFTRRALKKIEYSSMVDSQLLLIFDEIGDPGGSLPFKMCTKIFEGRINTKEAGHNQSYATPLVTG